MEHLNIKDTDILVRFLALETSATENKIVQKWLNESQQNIDYFNQVKSLWVNDNSQDLNQKYQTADVLQIIKQTISGSNKPIIKFKQYFIKFAAASILLLITCGVSLYVINTKNNTVITSTSKVFKITFPDNSVVWLNRYSKLIYSKNYNKNRGVKLIGEGYFVIKPDSSHPFEITTTDAKIMVVGTKFNVKAYLNDLVTEVVVTEGKVKLKGLNSKDIIKNEMILVKGEMGITGNDTVSPIKKPSDDPNFMSWRTHDFVFNNTNITEIINIVSKVYNAEIKIENTDTQNCNLTGRYSCYSLDDVLEMLRVVLNISVEKNGKTIIIKTNGC